MKLVRYGNPGKERPAMLDTAGALRDLSAVVADIDPTTLGPDALSAIRELDPLSLSIVPDPP